MLQNVEMPVWALALMALFALVALLDKILVPSVRWFLRRGLERAVARLNTRLARPIRPFKLARRRDTILRLAYDPAVAQAVADHAAEHGLREDVAHQIALRYAREIVPGFSALVYFGIAMRAARWLSRSLFRVRLAYQDEAAIEAIDPDATVVFVMNHRSNMDYVLVTWLVAERTALAYAVGEWARRTPLRQLFRAMGGYFIRRRGGDPLYRTVLARYVALATAGGVTQAIFPEGGLSRTGALGPPRLGLLRYIAEGFDPERVRDVVFVPVALSYDRVMEDRTLIAARTRGTAAFRASLMPVWRYLRRQIGHRLSGRPVPYGIAAVSFGRPLSLGAFDPGRTRDLAPELGAALMARVAEAMPVLPVPAVAWAVEAGADTMADVTVAVARLGMVAGRAGRPVWLHGDHDTRGAAAEGGRPGPPGGAAREVAASVDGALHDLAHRGALRITDGRISVTNAGKPLIAFYAAAAGVGTSEAAEVAASTAI